MKIYRCSLVDDFPSSDAYYPSITVVIQKTGVKFLIITIGHFLQEYGISHYESDRIFKELRHIWAMYSSSVAAMEEKVTDMVKKRHSGIMI